MTHQKPLKDTLPRFVLLSLPSAHADDLTALAAVRKNT
jgi:hypothetical protein